MAQSHDSNYSTDEIEALPTYLQKYPELTIYFINRYIILFSFLLNHIVCKLYILLNIIFLLIFCAFV